MRRPRLCRRSRSAVRNSSPSGRPSNRNPDTIEPSAGCNCVTRTSAGRAESETSLTELLAVDMACSLYRSRFLVIRQVKFSETVSPGASHAALRHGLFLTILYAALAASPGPRQDVVHQLLLLGGGCCHDAHGVLTGAGSIDIVRVKLTPVPLVEELWVAHRLRGGGLQER